ncbi:fimbrial protein [Dickeya lacustris]|uniref:Fimbrial protein n=1 Tax=Dickeya lacustris TaxID=2259638 RepID=A0ABY8GCF5_9GAMM|nr:fimbrial protein [Dickeya lacustris]WFN57577.1 fimbrial protein [Dickeya lacustris]
MMALTGIAQAADVTITVNGRVVAKPCTVSTSDAAVDLGELYTFNLANAGAASSWHSATLLLDNCPVGTSRVTATFSGTQDSHGYYRNDGEAKNISLQLQDEKGTTLNNGAKKEITVDYQTQSARFPLRVRALTVNGKVTQGSIRAVINVTYTYA